MAKCCYKCKEPKSPDEFLEKTHMICFSCFYKTNKYYSKIKDSPRYSQKQFTENSQRRESANKGFTVALEVFENKQCDQKYLATMMENLDFFDKTILFDDYYTYEQRKEIFNYE